MATATITEWNMIGKRPVTDPQAVSLTADFDPQSLELSYSPTGTIPGSYNKQTGPWSKDPPQQTGQSASLAVTLLFDTSTLQDISVQTKTEPMARLTLPRGNQDKAKAALPRRVIKFQWGTFLFFGCVESMTETIDFFTATGVPVRSSVHLTMSQVAGSEQTSGAAPATRGPGVSFGASAGIGAGASVGVGASIGASAAVGASAGVSAGVSVSAGAAIGTTPLTLSLEGDTIQGITARAGVSVSWKVVAAANNIDNPRLLPPGTVLSASAGAHLNAHAG